MARRPRLDFPGARHHVMNRSAGRTPFFVNDAGCAMFLDVLSEVPDRFGAHVHGYALMPNHYHLMVEVPRGNLSDVMRFVGATFTQAYNRQLRTDGSLFRGRFHNRVVQTDAYWMHLLAYLALNPVKAGLVKAPVESLWTHHAAYTRAALPPEWLTTDELLGLFGSAAAVEAYVQDVMLKRREPPDGFSADALWSTAETEAVPPPVRREPMEASEALAQVARAFGVDVADVLTIRRGPKPNTAAWVAVWWLLQATALSQRDVGEVAGMSRSRVSQIHRRAMKLYREDAAAKQIMDELTSTLTA